MAPKVQDNAGTGQKKKRVWPRVSPKQQRVSPNARMMIPSLMKMDWVSRHIYHDLICKHMPSTGEEILRCMTSDELLTGKANACKPLVQIIPLKNKNIKGLRNKEA